MTFPKKDDSALRRNFEPALDSQQLQLLQESYVTLSELSGIDRIDTKTVTYFQMTAVN
jgi:hypothetical protein